MEFTGSGRDVADPWYTGDFDTTWSDVTEGCTALLDYISERLLIITLPPSLTAYTVAPFVSMTRRYQ